MRFQKRQFHVARDRTGNQQHVGVTWRGDEVNSEAFNIVDRIVQGDNLLLTAIA